MPADPTLLYHLAEPDAWARRSDTYQPDSLGDDGFIHCSGPEQWRKVAREIYPGRDDLLLLTIDARRVSGILRHEDLYDVGEEFPHLYGALPVEAVVRIEPVTV